MNNFHVCQCGYLASCVASGARVAGVASGVRVAGVAGVVGGASVTCKAIDIHDSLFLVTNTLALYHAKAIDILFSSWDGME